MTQNWNRLTPRDYARIEKVLAYLDLDWQGQPDLGTLGRAAGLSPLHLQRLFSRWVGISPKRFLEYLTLEHAKASLREGASVFEASLDAGLSGPARLHDHFVTLEALTPGEYAGGGTGLEIEAGCGASPFGSCFVAWTARGVCALSFLSSPDAAGEELRALAARFPGARVVENHDRAQSDWLQRVFAEPSSRRPLHLMVKGTNFQVRVWEALLRLPEGCVTSYSSLAAGIGRPEATRAVAGAVGANEIAWLIPCHRVIRAQGTLGGYRWGCGRKRVMLALEQAQAGLIRSQQT